MNSLTALRRSAPKGTKTTKTKKKMTPKTSENPDSKSDSQVLVRPPFGLLPERHADALKLGFDNSHNGPFQPDSVVELCMAKLDDLVTVG